MFRFTPPAPPPSRLYLLRWLTLALLGTSFTTRIILAFRSDVHASLSELLGAFAIGFGFDLVTALFALAPLALWLALMPNRVARWPLHRMILLLGCAVSVFLLLLNGVAEWVFWDEFSSRYNFIAVDYLVYTHEVLGNIWESYPVGKILIALAVLAIGLVATARQRLWAAAGSPIQGRTRLAILAAALALPMASYSTVSSAMKAHFAHDTTNELAGNGMFEFAAAASNNELDFLKLYATIPESDAFALVRAKLAPSSGPWRAREADAPDPQRQIVASPGPERHLNVVLISIESLGADYVGSWGAQGKQSGLTPNIDALAKESLTFTQVYATGNRTVRGLEALSLAIPPTPGQSIVKRPHNEQLFTLGSVLKGKGYDTRFIYGGYAPFDNMGPYFDANDYTTVDRRVIPSERIHYENIWGVADEDLFDLSIEQIDNTLAASQGKRPVFAHIMTTSNHRPYTYPAGRIDVPSGTNREGAVKYTDWAVGRFIAEARKKPWFANTLFVITADHGANARGSSEIPVDNYRIPLLFYAPALLKPGHVDRLMSQIDIPPTLLGRLNMSYVSKFYGQDIYRVPPGEERAFVANYQTLGYLRDGRLVTLQPRKVIHISDNANAGPRRPDGLDDATLQREAIAWYQSAFLVYHRALYGSEKHGDATAAQSPIANTATAR